MQLYGKQKEVLISIQHDAETFCHAANELGKTRIAAVAALWFFLSRQPCRVVTSSSSQQQLESILWREMLHLIETSKFKFPIDISHLRIRKLADPNDSQKVLPLDYLIGSVTRTVESFQGHHLPNDKPRVMALFEEASGIPDEFHEASDSWAHRKLVIGNPLSNHNFFYRLCKAGCKLDPAGEARLMRNVIHIDGLDSPNVKIGLEFKRRGLQGMPPLLINGLLSYVEYLRRSENWDEIQRTTRLHGRFFEGAQSFMFPPAWLDNSIASYVKSQGILNRRVLAMGVDTAQGGRDATVWTGVDELGVIFRERADISDSMEIVGKTVRYIEDMKINPRDVALDAGGGGKEIADRLREQGYPVETVYFGAQPTTVKAGASKKKERQNVENRQVYKNRRVEMYGILRNLMRPDLGESNDAFGIPPDAYELRRELAILPLQYDSEGKMVLPPKDEQSTGSYGHASLKALLGHSPDESDSLVLATFALKRRVGRIRSAGLGLEIDPDKAAEELMDGFEDRLKSLLGT